jgi:hypothetical protein
MASPLNILIVDKTATLKSLTVKEFSESDLYKKCGFKQPDKFEIRNTWNVKYPSGSTGKRYHVSLFAKNIGRANSENKYDFPPPVDNDLYFGSCALIAKTKNVDGTLSHTNLSVELWEKIYEKLFGGFEDLAVTALEDENEIDELENVPKEFKTKQGYLKDGFVVDDNKTETNSFCSSKGDEDDYNESDNLEDTSISEQNSDSDSDSELSKDKYDYDAEK